MTGTHSSFASVVLFALVLGGGLVVGGCADEPAATPPATAPDQPAVTATAEGVKPYPLDVCIVSEEKLGSMGEPVALVHEGQEVKFCCDGCVPEFRADPAKFLARLDTAAPATGSGGADHNHADHDHAGHKH